MTIPTTIDMAVGNPYLFSIWETPLSIPQINCPMILSLFGISHKLFLFKQLNFQKILP